MKVKQPSVVFKFDNIGTGALQLHAWSPAYAIQDVQTTQVSINSPYLPLPRDSSHTKIVALRFLSIGIPPLTPISSCYIQFTNVGGSVAGNVAIKIQAELSASPAGFQATSNNVSSRTLTNAFVVWSPPNWTITNESSTREATPDLSAVMTELLALPSWTSGTSVVFIFSLYVGSTNGTNATRIATSAPELWVTAASSGETCDTRHRDATTLSIPSST